MDSLREVTDILNIRLSEDETYCIAVDQTRLPGELCYVDLRTAEDYYTAIKLLQVRGAPCIGITAGYAMYCLAQTLPTEKQAFLAEYDRLSAYIHADKELRAKRIVEVYGEREDSPEKRVADKDKARAAFYKQYTRRDWGDAENYHITLDSGKLGLETCINLLVELY